MASSSLHLFVSFVPFTCLLLFFSSLFIALFSRSALLLQWRERAGVQITFAPGGDEMGISRRTSDKSINANTNGGQAFDKYIFLLWRTGM